MNENLILTKDSNPSDIERYFRGVLALDQQDKVFSVNLDDVWQLVYSERSKAVRALKANFIENVDFIPLAQNGKRLASGKFSGENKVTYMLSVPCLEFFIARKVRPVFEVYRQVFHKVAKGDVTPQEQFDVSEPIGLEETILPLSDFMHQVNEGWESLKLDVVGHICSDDVKATYNEWVTTYRRMISQLTQLVQFETINKIEGAYFIKLTND